MKLPVEIFRCFIFMFSSPKDLGKLCCLNKEFYNMICQFDKGKDLPHVSWVDGNKLFRSFNPVFKTRLKVVDLYTKLVSKTILWEFRTRKLDTENYLHKGILDIFKLVFPFEECPTSINIIIGWFKNKNEKTAFLATRKFPNLFTFQNLTVQSPLFHFETDWLSTEKPITQETIWKSFEKKEFIIEGFYLNIDTHTNNETIQL